ncbi:hypothetical protein A6770_06960 [Nostoc minutum NIES-26]|uniref:DUF2281 domain-containing protein n=1 Tax=Nostoc minutum NIES-26 TaxID=1844469 RepID=A0A367Q2Q2_9NOSO|nr:hypothetical protein A6770_06960 [Nostoc minutum NIES-26]
MTTKQALFDAIEQLPEQYFTDVLQYVQQLARNVKSPTSNPPTESSDPLADFIGATSHGSLAANLDSEFSYPLLQFAGILSDEEAAQLQSLIYQEFE